MSIPREPDLIVFLSDCAYMEQDQDKKATLQTLVDNWRRPEPGADPDEIWSELRTASHEYSEAPGYRENWDE